MLAFSIGRSCPVSLSRNVVTKSSYSPAMTENPTEKNQTWILILNPHKTSKLYYSFTFSKQVVDIPYHSATQLSEQMTAFFRKRELPMSSLNNNPEVKSSMYIYIYIYKSTHTSVKSS